MADLTDKTLVEALQTATSSETLVERLQSLSLVVDNRLPPNPGLKIFMAMHEAAHRIAADRARIEALEKALRDLLHELDTDDVGGLVEGRMEHARNILEVTDLERDLCGCIKCTDARAESMRVEGVPTHMTFPGPGLPGWRYACEKCGNKRCPHHSDHTLKCTGSNEPGQPGSFYQ